MKMRHMQEHPQNSAPHSSYDSRQLNIRSGDLVPQFMNLHFGMNILPMGSNGNIQLLMYV